MNTLQPKQENESLEAYHTRAYIHYKQQDDSMWQQRVNILYAMLKTIKACINSEIQPPPAENLAYIKSTLPEVELLLQLLGIAKPE
jgi:hypothetical protein